MRLKLPYLLLFLLACWGCSSENNTWTSKAYHNTTAHYNGYYYARDEIRKIEAAISENHVDDYNRILRIYPSFDSTLGKTFEKEIEEAIKMASIAIQRHPNSKWVDDAYILVGKARHYSMDWGNAIQTFKYANKVGMDRDTKHTAILSLIRTYIEHQEYANAQAAIDYLQKQKLSRVNRKKLHLEKAYLHQIHSDFDNMVRSLTEAGPYLKKKDRRGRIYFIIGQVYQKLGFEAEAYNYYKKCISTNPEYEVDFYARLYMAQVTEISRSKDVEVARRSFRKLLKDLKNKEFRDKIFYEMGVFEVKQNNLNEGIAHFNRSIRTGTNTRIDGEAYLALGQIYYDTLRKYELSQAYYDSAIRTLPADYEGYEQIKTRSEILNEFVKHLKTIQWQDSLLSLASLDSATLRVMVDSVVAEREKLAEEKRARTRKRSNRVDITGNDNANIFDLGDEGDAVMESPEGGGGWYFGNPSAIAVGQTEFARVWGNIPLQDNWRRSMRESSRMTSTSPGDDQNPADGGDDPGAATEGVAASPAEQEFQQLNNEIPRTEEARAAALKKIEEAYFRLGEIYYFKLQENENAVSAYADLLRRFPSSEFEPEALYTLYLILKDSNPDAANGYAENLKSKYPGSTFARILVNPSYLQESSQAAEKQKQLYRVAYDHFENADYRAADSVLVKAHELGETMFTPSLDLLSILIDGETEDVAQYQYRLGEFIQNYPGTEMAAYAEKLLQTSRTFLETQEKRRGIQYIRSLDEPHYFVILYKRSDKLEDQVPAALEKFNREYFADRRLNISNLIFNDQFAMTFVADLENVSTAIEYYLTFRENLPAMSGFRNYKFDNFVITKDNFDIFYRTKGLDEYQQFFEKNYPKE